MLSLYPAIEPFEQYHLNVPNQIFADDAPKNACPEIAHQIYVEQCGNPLGIPVIFLHGGPGSGCRPSHRCYFDPQLYHIILFDQRGCGRSYPYGALAQNTTAHIAHDMELIRQHIGIKKWLVFGGSWGATLGLYYAQHFSEQVSGLILRGVFLARTQDIDWVYGENGAAKIFPDLWNNLVADLPLAQQAQPLQAIYQQLSSNNIKVSSAILNKLQHWETNLINWQGLIQLEKKAAQEDAKVSAIIQLYYSMHHCFIGKQPLLERIDNIRHIPTKIIHGRLDMVCPVEQAWQLKIHWPEAELSIIEMAGHVATEAKIIDALVKATNDFVKV